MKKILKDAFEKAKNKAESLSQDPDSTEQLLNKAYQKGSKNKNILKQTKDDFFTLIRLLLAWTKGQYKKAPWRSILYGLAAMVYFVNPLDLVPDFITGAGLMDDLTVLGFVFSLIKDDLEEFREWEKQQKIEG